jgi:hypothetical protein
MRGYYCCQLIRKKVDEKGEKGLTGARPEAPRASLRNCVANLNGALTCAITKGGLQAAAPGVGATVMAARQRQWSLTMRRYAIAVETPQRQPPTPIATGRVPGQPSSERLRQPGRGSPRRPVK